MLLKMETHPNRQGNLSVIEDFPFKVKRVFCIYNVPPGETRGGHAHKKCEQILIATHGAVLVKIIGGPDYVLDCPDIGLYVPHGFTIQMEFLDEATLTVLASEKYDAEDYVYGN